MKKIVLLLLCVIAFYTGQAQNENKSSSEPIELYDEHGCVGADGLLYVYFDDNMHTLHGSNIFIWVYNLGVWTGPFSPISVAYNSTTGEWEYIYYVGFPLEDHCYDFFYYNDRNADPEGQGMNMYKDQYCPCPIPPCNANFCYKVCTDAPNIVTVMPAENHASAGSTYHWDYGNGHTSSYPQSVIYAPGSYTICHTEIQRDGTRCEACMDLCVNDGSQGGGHGDGRKEPTNINTPNGTGSIELYPNPASAECAVKLSIIKTSDVSIRVTDMAGRLLIKMDKKQLEAGKHTISISTDALASGSYIVEVVNGQQVSTHKLSVIK